MSNIILINFNLDRFQPLIHVWHRLENGGMAMIKLALQLAEIGKIKIGKKGKEITSKAGNKFRPPVKFDHFEVTTANRDGNGDLVLDTEIMEQYPKDPKTLNIFFLFDDIDQNFQTRYALFTKSECKCSGDGVVAMRKLKTGQTEEVDCDPETCPFYQNKQCKISGVLNCLLAESQTVGGIYKLRTHSFHSVRNILSSLVLVQELTGGILSGIKFQLTISPKAASVEGRATTIQVLNIEYRGLRKSLLDTVLAIKKDRITFGTNMKQLELKEESIREMTADQIKEISEEFYPESIVEPETEIVKADGTEIEVVNKSQKLTTKEPEAEEVPASEVKDINAELIAKCIDLERKIGVTKEQLIAKRTAMIGTPKIHGCSSPISLANYHSSLEAELELKVEGDKVKNEAKKELEALRTAILDIYTTNKVSVEQQRQFNYETLKTAELSSSRTKAKLETLLELVKMNYDVGDMPAEDDEGEL